jgi:hypothetical protein
VPSEGTEGSGVTLLARYQSLKAYQLKALDKAELLEALTALGGEGDASLPKKELLELLAQALK